MNDDEEIERVEIALARSRGGVIFDNITGNVKVEPFL